MRVRKRIVVLVLLLVVLIPSVALAGECEDWLTDCYTSCGPGPSACREVCHENYTICTKLNSMLANRHLGLRI